MIILVTGGAGFIGSNFILYELERYPRDRIICLDALTYAGSLSNLESSLQKDQFQCIKADICDRQKVYDVFRRERPDILVNFAAESHVDRSIEDPAVFFRTNIEGTAVLLDACRRYGIRRFHQISTDEVYGDLPLDGEDLLFNEESPLRPSSPYSASKASADLIIQSYVRTYGLPVSISRSSNNYGPRQFPEKLIPLMIRKAAAEERLPVYGDGSNVRDWVYVEDNCRAVDFIIRKGRAGQTYNVGGNCQISNIHLVKMICDHLGKPYSLIEYVKDRPGHDRRYALDSSKIRDELGWEPQVSPSDGLRRTISWYTDRKR